MVKQFGIVAAAGAALLLLVPSMASAQRDAGAKMRGEFGRGSSISRGASPRMAAPVMAQPIYQPRVVTPPVAAQPDYAAYSVAPLPYEVGDQVRVASSQAQLMRGNRVLGRAQQGEEVQVVRIMGPWVGTTLQVGDQTVGGWIWYRHLEPAE